VTIQIAQRIGRALDVRSATKLNQLDQALREYIRSVGPGATVPLTGSFPWSNLTGVPATFPPSAHTHPNGDLTGYTAADVLAKLLTVDGAGSGLDADLLDGISSAAFAQKEANETVNGTWSFSDGRIVNSAARVAFSSAVVNDDATQAFNVPYYGLVAVSIGAGGTVAYNGLFWVASSGETTGSINVGANFSLGTTVNPDVDGNVNAWMSGSGQLSVKNRFGSARVVTVMGLGHNAP
jgi:hypothetical protein